MTEGTLDVSGLYSLWGGTLTDNGNVTFQPGSSLDNGGTINGGNSPIYDNGQGRRDYFADYQAQIQDRYTMPAPPPGVSVRDMALLQLV